MFDFFSRLNCPRCGRKITEAEKSCPHCGLDLEWPLDEYELSALAEPYLEKARRAFDSSRNLSAGLADCEQALEYLPESAEAHDLRGLLLDSLGRMKEAISEYREALRIDPDFQDARENLAEAEAEVVLLRPL